MIETLLLPFPLLSDPDRSGVIEPYGLADPKDRRNLARPATVIVTPDGAEPYRRVSRDYADRPTEDEVVAAVRAQQMPPTTQEPPQPGPAAAGPNAFAFENLVPYMRGARFAVNAIGSRFPEAREEANAYMEQVDRYTEAAKAVFKAKKQS